MGAFGRVCGSQRRKPPRTSLRSASVWSQGTSGGTGVQPTSVVFGDGLSAPASSVVIVQEPYGVTTR